MSLTNQRYLLLATILATVLVADVAQAAPPAPPSGSLSEKSSLDELILKPGEDPDTLSSWTKSSRKFSFQFKRLFGREPNESAARDLFASGETLFREGKFEEAAKKFKAAGKRWPDSPLEEDAMYMQSESLFFAERYSRASDTYGNMMKKYENSRYLERSVGRQFSIARYWEEVDRQNHHWLLTPNLTDKTRPLFDTRGNAIAAYESVHLNDPTGPLADDSVMATANIHFLDERYEDADYYYGLIRTQYPQSEHQEIAHQLDLRAKMRKYQGPYYDSKPLEEATELIQQISVQFPNLPADEKERQRNADRAIRNQRAQRDWETAEYYARIRRFGGARYYYNVVAKEFSDTPFAELANQRLKEFEGRPDNPPERFGWLVTLFNGRKDQD